MTTNAMARIRSHLASIQETDSLTYIDMQAENTELLEMLDEQIGAELKTAVEAIHQTAVDTYGEDNIGLNGCACPKCESTSTYDFQLSRNYYFVCIDCKKAVAIWLDKEIQDIVSQPWIVLPD